MQRDPLEMTSGTVDGAGQELSLSKARLCMNERGHHMDG